MATQKTNQNIVCKQIFALSGQMKWAIVRVANELALGKHCNDCTMSPLTFHALAAQQAAGIGGESFSSNHSLFQA